jgi:hypothetical protein
VVERITRWIKQFLVALVVVFLGFWSISGGIIITLRVGRFCYGQAIQRVEEVKRELRSWPSLF